MSRSVFRPEATWGSQEIGWEVPIAERWSLRHLELEYILVVLRSTHNHRGRAAEILGIDRRTLYRKIRQLEYWLEPTGDAFHGNSRLRPFDRVGGCAEARTSLPDVPS